MLLSSKLEKETSLSIFSFAGLCLLAVACLTSINASPDPSITEAETQLRQGNRIEALRALQQAPSESHAEIAQWIQRNLGRLDALFLYHLAALTFASDRAEGMRWFLGAWLWAAYDAHRCQDQTATAGLSFLAQLAPDVAAYIASHPEEAAVALERALRWEQTSPSPSSPEWICVHGIQSFLQGGRQRVDIIRPSREWPEIRRTVRESAQADIETLKRQAEAAPRQGADSAASTWEALANPAGGTESSASARRQGMISTKLVRRITLDVPSFAHHMAWSHDSQRLAVGGSLDKRMSVWDLRTGQRLPNPGDQIGGVHGLAYSGDGRYLAVVRAPVGAQRGGQERYTVSLWDARTAALVRNVVEPDPT